MSYDIRMTKTVFKELWLLTTLPLFKHNQSKLKYKVQDGVCYLIQ